MRHTTGVFIGKVSVQRVSQALWKNALQPHESRNNGSSSLAFSRHIQQTASPIPKDLR